MALNWAETAYKTSPETHYIANTYAHLLYENGKRKEAVRIGAKALELATQANQEKSMKDYKAALERFKKKE